MHSIQYIFLVLLGVLVDYVQCFYFQYGQKQAMMDLYRSNQSGTDIKQYVTTVYLQEAVQCKIIPDSGRGHYGAESIEALHQLLDLQSRKCTELNMAIKFMSSIQFLFPPGHYEIILHLNKSHPIMRVFPLQKRSEFNHFGLETLADEYVLVKKEHVHSGDPVKVLPSTPKTPKQRSKAKTVKAIGPLIWTERDKHIMESKWKELEELCDLHAEAAAMYDHKEKFVFVKYHSTNSRDNQSLPNIECFVEYLF